MIKLSARVSYINIQRSPEKVTVKSRYWCCRSIRFHGYGNGQGRAPIKRQGAESRTGMRLFSDNAERTACAIRIRPIKMNHKSLFRETFAGLEIYVMVGCSRRPPL